MREIQIAANKTLKLTNVLARKIEAEEFANLQIVLTQMQNFMKSNNAQPIGPMIQCIKIPSGRCGWFLSYYLVSIKTSTMASSSS